MQRNRAFCRWTSVTSALLASAIGMMATSSEVSALPRNEMRAAYGRALAAFNDLEIEAALETVSAALAEADSSGSGEDPVLASLFLLRAGLRYSLEGAEGRAAILEDLTKAVTLNYYVVVPLEFRSEELSAFLTEARRMSGRKAPSRIEHKLPEVACEQDIQFEALLGVPDGGTAVLYWKRASAETFQEVEMEVFSNVAETTVSAPEHGGFDVEYAIYSFDANGQAAYNKGTADQPIVLRLGCKKEEDLSVVRATAGEVDGAPPKEVVPLPRVWINLGLGTGFGLASGRAEKTYYQDFPNSPGSQYNAESYACALARWSAGAVGQPLPDAISFYGADAANPNSASLVGKFGPTVPGQAAQVASAYDPTKCGTRHPVTNGLAGSPFFIEPEVQVKVLDRLTVSLYGRLQVVSGSKVIRDNPNKDLGNPGLCGDTNAEATGANGTSWCDDIYTVDPQSLYRDRPPFTWAIGSKIRYYFLKETSKIRLFAGGFGGYGQSRLRVDMGFANDTNGNSIPDDREDTNGYFALNPSDPSTCFPIFPYRDACANLPEVGGTAGTPVESKTIAQQFASSNSSGTRYDTVAIGQGFLGGIFGFNYQIMKNFAVFGEIQVGGWFPDNSSFLVDLNVGPAVTF